MFAKLITVVTSLSERPNFVGRFVQGVRREGLGKMLSLVAAYIRREQRQAVVRSRLGRHVGDRIAKQPAVDRSGDLFVPLYLDPFGVARPREARSERVLVWVTVPSGAHISSILEALRGLPGEFDLRISVTDPANLDAIASKCAGVGGLRSVTLRDASTDASPLQYLLSGLPGACGSYDIIGYVDATDDATEARPVGGTVGGGVLLGSTSGVDQIFTALLSDARIIVPGIDWRRRLRSATSFGPTVMSNFADPFTLGRASLADMLCDSEVFWLSARALSGSSARLDMPWCKQADSEPGSRASSRSVAAAQLASVIQRANGKNYAVFTSMTAPPHPAYEIQLDYSGLAPQGTVKVLAFYLPQPPPTPVNVTSYGHGFTDWRKVRAANPLFVGHYQQHVPHPDLGYYQVESPQLLRIKWGIMQKAGVYGLIFCHYRSHGKLLFEPTAQVLLRDRSIEMPFCFFWASENWTKRGYGNEEQTLLDLDESEADAAAFIRHLIPFFKDERYITIAARPVLFVDCPSSLEHWDQYRGIWADNCRLAGLPAPYLIATRTRDAVHPGHFGMDGCCESVLHDWANGSVRERCGDLTPYRPIKGSVLDYGDVSNFYMNQPPPTDFPYFRSVMPMWDNTPRYDTRASIVHASSPRQFQRWVEALVEDAAARQGEDERWLTVNAWNGWADGAHLEPDRRFGYAYLNSVGRALSGIRYTDREYRRVVLNKATVLRVTLATALLEALRADDAARARFAKCIEVSSVLGTCQICADSEVVEAFPLLGPVATTAELARCDFELVIRKFCLFDPDSIKTMLQAAVFHGGCSVTPTHWNDEDFDHLGLDDGAATESSTYMYVRGFGSPALRCCNDAALYVSAPDGRQALTPRVATILRIHRGGRIHELARALYSLAAQAGCCVRPIIAAQNLTVEQSSQLNRVLADIPWEEDCAPLVRHYAASAPNADLRALMLNDALRSIDGGYATILDYDDVVFHDAYAWLVGRLRSTRKNAAFGLVYSTEFDGIENRIGTRSVMYGFGSDYRSFVNNNHAPIHSFMLDLEKIDLDGVAWEANMKYMEDYFLTLQIFSERDTDWDSLVEGRFIGDYYHRTDCLRENTLALVDDEKRRVLLSDSEFIACERRINQLRARIKGGR